ncbi:MAG: hypothetical protein QXM16_09255 [Nitrososphaerota archaeon]
MAEDDNYIEDYISAQGIYYSNYDNSGPGHRRPEGRLKRPATSDELDTPRGLISARAVFYVIFLTALATSLINPPLLLYTLPLVVFLSSLLALASKRRTRRPRRLVIRNA